MPPEAVVFESDPLAGVAAPRPSAWPAMEPVGLAGGRSPWTMPSFYLVPFMCLYLLGAVWIIRGFSLIRYVAVRGRRGNAPSGDGGARRPGRIGGS